MGIASTTQKGTNYGRFDKEQSSLTLVTMSGSPILSIDYETINNSTTQDLTSGSSATYTTPTGVVESPECWCQTWT